MVEISEGHHQTKGIQPSVFLWIFMAFAVLVFVTLLMRILYEIITGEYMTALNVAEHIKEKNNHTMLIFTSKIECKIEHRIEHIINCWKVSEYHNYYKVERRLEANKKISFEGWKNVPCIWMSHAPTASVSRELLEHFKRHDKPTIFIGNIIQYTKEDRQELKNLMEEGFKIKVWVEVAKCISTHQVQVIISGTTKELIIGDRVYQMANYIDQLKNERDGENYTDREREVVIIACGEEGVTHLLTDNGTLYRSTRRSYNSNGPANENHAEMIFLDNIERTNTIRIKNSPCALCCDALINHYEGEAHKPEIKFGRVYNPDGRKKNMNGNNETPAQAEQHRKTVELYKAGFELSVWKPCSDYMCEHKNPNKKQAFKRRTIEYLERVKREAMMGN